MAHDEERQPLRQEDPPGLLERQRRRASLQSWILLGLTLSVFLAGVLWLPLGKAEGQLKSDEAAGWTFNLAGSGFHLAWAGFVFFLLREYRNAVAWARNREEQQQKQEDREEKVRILKKHSYGKELSLLIAKLLGIELDQEDLDSKTGKQERSSKPPTIRLRLADSKPPEKTPHLTEKGPKESDPRKPGPSAKRELTSVGTERQKTPDSSRKEEDE